MLLPHDITFLEALAMNYGLRIDIDFPKLNSNRSTRQALNTPGGFRKMDQPEYYIMIINKSAYLS